MGSSTIPSGLFSNSAGEIFVDLGHNNFTGKLPQSLYRHASNTRYLAIMRNDFEADAVEEAICDQVLLLLADCSSCPCCKGCCEDNYVLENDFFCNFELNFHELSGLEGGAWWEGYNT